MKKILSFALSLMLALTLLGTAAFADAGGFAGTWYTRIYGIEMSFTLKDDGLYTVTFDYGDTVEGSDGVWETTSTGIVFDKGTADEVVMTYDAKADTLTGVISGMEMIFTSEPAAAFELAPARSDAAPKDYDGQWAATLLCLGEIQTTPQESQFDLLMTVEGGLNCFTMIIEGQNYTLNIVPEFADGAMLLNMSDGTTSSSIVCRLLEDGSMSAAFPKEMFGQEAVIVLERI
ncbi:MAG: hypothetical protein ACI4MK_00135 [Aristaeellaceae bacterium]